MRKPFIILLHLAYWLVYLLLLAVLFLALYPQAGGSFVGGMFASLPGIVSVLPPMAMFYLSYFWLHPRYLQRKRWGALAGMGASSLLGIAGAATALMLGSLFSKGGFVLATGEVMGSLIFFTLLCGIHGTLALVMRGFVVSIADLRLKEELRRKNVEMELELVRAQLNPHFLFNTLNNIDVLIGRDPALASAYLQRLSGLLRFMLYDAQADRIPLSLELEWLGQYLDLQRIRSSNADWVEYTLEGSPDGLMVAPMTLIPFVENAFKHTDAPRSGPGIRIAVRVAGGQVTFTCVNKLGRPANTPDQAGGLGLPLVVRRLELLYGDKASLEQGAQGEDYHVNLILQP